MEDTTTNNRQQKEDELFYFESDHLALKGNKDYSELLKTLFILTAQRERAFKDYEKIQEMKRNALEDPQTFLEKFKNNELEFPPLQTIPEIPIINWYGYNMKVSEEELKEIYSDKTTHKKDVIDFGKQSSKSTHKKHWTPEEQKRLEELLVIYPPEPIELRRIKKIAAALGNRTVAQVSSRLQKYFLKLHKAGLHVPGRIPKSSSSSQKKHNKHKHGMWKPTTFFPEYNVSVFMDDTESVPGPSTQTNMEPSSSLNTNYLMPLPDYYHQEASSEKSERLMKLELLKWAKEEEMKMQEIKEPYRHLTFKCDRCNEEPIIGTRWHCSTCIQKSVNFCTDCFVAQIYSDYIHPLNHKFVTFPHSDDHHSNMSSSSDSESVNGNSNNNDISDSELSTYSNSSWRKVKQSSSTNGDNFESNGRNGMKRNSDETDVSNLEADFLNQHMYSNEKDVAKYSTQEVGYSYLHSNLSLND